MLHLSSSFRSHSFKQSLSNHHFYSLNHKSSIFTKKHIQNQYQITLYQNRNLQTLSTNLIQNHDFSITTCTNKFCIWYTKNFTSTFLPSWEPLPQIQIGYLYAYNFTGTIRVVDLVPDHPSCIQQFIKNVSSGIYQLTYVHSKSYIVAFNSSTVLVYVNDTKIDENTPKTTSWTTKTVNITINQKNTSFYVKFCSLPGLKDYGPILWKVSLFKVAQLPLIIAPQNLAVPSNAEITTNTSSPTDVNMTRDIQGDDEHSIDFLQQNYVIFTFFKFFLLQRGINEVAGSNSVLLPTYRTLFRKQFSFLVNLDHLLLYRYHQRTYGNNLKQIFLMLQDYQDTKWDFFLNFLQTTFSFNFDTKNVQQNLSKKLEQTPINYYALQQSGRQFLAYNFKFFLFNVPFVIVIYFSFRFLHWVFQIIQIQKIFIQYTLKSYLFLILLEGNVEVFSYLLIADIVTMNFKEITLKATNLSSLMFAYFMFIFLISLPFLLRSKYQNKKNIQFFDKSSNSLRGVVYFMVQFGLFNIILGFTHLLLQNHPTEQILTLLFIEVSFIFYNILNLSKFVKIFRHKLRIWIGVYSSFLRVNLISTCYFYGVSSQNLKQKIQVVQLILMAFYLFLLVASIFNDLIFQFSSSLSLCIQKIKKSCSKEDSKQKTQLKEKISIVSDKIFVDEQECSKQLNSNNEKQTSLNQQKVQRNRTDIYKAPTMYTMEKKQLSLKRAYKSRFAPILRMIKFKRQETMQIVSLVRSDEKQLSTTAINEDQ